MLLAEQLKAANLSVNNFSTIKIWSFYLSIPIKDTLQLLKYFLVNIGKKMKYRADGSIIAGLWKFMSHYDEQLEV